MSHPVSVIATFTPALGKEDDVEKILRGMIEPTRGETGCQRYDFYRTSAAPGLFMLFEMYVDQAALEAHRRTVHYKTYRATITDLLAEPIKVSVLEGLDVKG